MRITGGLWRGRVLTSFQGPHLRPTTDLVKKSVFDTIGERVIDSDWLDLFAGTGAIGFEALSRGARQVTAVEANRKSISILGQNARLLNCNDQLLLVPGKVNNFLKGQSLDHFHFIYLDPPYNTGDIEEVLTLLGVNDTLTLGLWVIVEASRRQTVGAHYGQLSSFRNRIFGDTQLVFFTNTPQEGK